MPLPSATEHVDGQSTEHPLGEEARVVLEDLKDPFVVERFHPRFPFSGRNHDSYTPRSSFVQPEAASVQERLQRRALVYW